MGTQHHCDAPGTSGSKGRDQGRPSGKASGSEGFETGRRTGFNTSFSYCPLALIIACLLALSGLRIPGAVAPGGPTIVPDGDLGDWVPDEIMGTDATKTFRITWDVDNIYFGWEGTDWGNEGDLFLYFNTTEDGSRTSMDWGGTHTLPFKADLAFAVEGSDYYDVRRFSSGSWNIIENDDNLSSPTPYIGWTDNNITELAISRDILSSPSTLDVLAFAQWEVSNNVWASFPTENPGGGDGNEIFTHFYEFDPFGPNFSPDSVTVGERTGGVEPREDALNLAIVWHQHQPYYKNVLTGKYEMPWVRVHGSQEYLDSPKILMEHPGVKVNFNIVPSLMVQIDDYAENEVLDRNTEWVERELDNLTEPEKHTMQFEFFWVPSWQYNMDNAASRYYHYLHNKTMHNLTPETIMADTLLPEDELFDLTVLYHLFQISPWYVKGLYEEEEKDPYILDLYDKYGDYSETDLEYVLEKQKDILGSVPDLYAEARDAGQAELTTSPYSHPILPLLMMAGWKN